MLPSNESDAAVAATEFEWNSSLASDDEDDCWSTLRCQLETTRFAVQKIILPVVVTFGVLGNAVCVTVLTRPWMKSSTNRYLTALAVYDLLYLCSVTLTFDPPTSTWVRLLSVTFSISTLTGLLP